MLDEAFRQRLRDLAVDAGSPPGLDADAQQRVLSAVRSQGPRVLQRTRRSRLALRVAGPALAAAAVAIVLLRSPSEPDTAKPSQPRGQTAASVAKACEAWTPQVSAGTSLVHAAVGRRLDLGRLGVAAAPEAADVQLVRAEPCETVLELGSGRVVVRADELGGGALSVVAGHTRVSVRGTLFSVEREDARVAVEVLEGTVAVSHEGRTHSVAAGERLTLTQVGTARGEVLPESEAAAMRLIQGPKVIELESLDPEESAMHAVLPPPAQGKSRPAGADPASAAEADAPGAESAAEAPEASHGALLAKAERLRRSGDYDAARELYRRVGAAPGVTGEAALLALTRMELALGRTEAAGQAATMRRGRFGRGSLGPEAQWIEVRIHRQAGRDAEARGAAQELVKRWPSSPQAAAAKHWLASSH